MDSGADQYAKHKGLSLTSFQYILTRLCGAEIGSDAKEELKKAALVFINHKTYDPNRIFPDNSSAVEWAKNLGLDKLCPEIYEAILHQARA